MNDADRIRQTLAQLHQELASAELKDPEVRHALEHALRQISGRLEQDAAPADSDDPAAQLRAAARRFEVDHPALASTVEGLIDALARMGI